MLSLSLAPVSALASRSAGALGLAGAVVSSVKMKALLAGLALPAASVCLTKTLLSPSPLMPVMVVPEPLIQLEPPSRLYCQVAPKSNPVTFKVLVLVILSVLLVPESVAKAKPGGET